MENKSLHGATVPSHWSIQKLHGATGHMTACM